MNAELNRLRKEMTREEFIRYQLDVTYNCPHTYGLDDAKRVIKTNSNCGAPNQQHCELCVREAVKDIQFKDDIPDTVNHPSHYTAGKYEVIDIIESIVNSMDLTPYQGYLLGNIIKYIARFKHKGGAEDLKKAAVYLEKLTKAVGE